MDDLIKRADAIEAVQKIVPYVIDKDTGQWGILVNKANVITELSALPSADAVHGEWIYDGQNFKGGLNWCHCSECGYKTSTNGLSIYRYCPSCGAIMKGGDE